MELCTLHKPSKGEAFELVKSLKAGEELSEIEIDTLINYFAPSLPKKAKTAFQWVASACNPKDVRPFTNVVYVKNGEMVASDGHRMHWAKTDLVDGVYDPKTGLAVDDTSYSSPPAFDAVKAYSKDGEKITLDNSSLIVQGGVRLYALTDKIGVNATYVYKALNGNVGKDVGFLEDQIAGESEYGNFVVMGARI